MTVFTIARNNSFETTGIKAFFRTASNALAVSRQRRALARLDNDRLVDLGLTRADVTAELQRPIWNAPHHWTR